jgi:hypothetical protein
VQINREIETVDGSHRQGAFYSWHEHGRIRAAIHLSTINENSDGIRVSL